MSRVVNIDATADELVTFCAQNDIPISVLEPLDSGGTRIVLNKIEDADVLRLKMKKRLIDGPTTRSKLHLARTQPSYI